MNASFFSFGSFLTKKKKNSCTLTKTANTDTNNTEEVV